MNKKTKCFLLLFVTFITFSSNSQKKKTYNSQIGEYVVETFQDSKGNLWFGTLEKGVAKYDGKKLSYLTTKDGLPSNRIVSIIEDNSGNVWFGTGNGLSKFDGKSFINYSEKDGLCSNRISNLFIDSKNNFWVGTWRGVCKFDGFKFKNFPIPYPKIETKINESTKDWITKILEDSQGNIWFSRDGYGAVKFNGNSFSHFLKKNGLYSNNVTEIAIDRKGTIWFGSRVAEKDNIDPEKRKGKGGVTIFNGKTASHFPKINGLNNADVFEIYKDNLNNLWISTINYGVYKYDGNEFKNYNVPISIMSIIKDKKGNFWLGGASGLYRIDKKGNINNVTTSGPWD